MNAIVKLEDVIRSGPPSIDSRGMLFELDGRVYRAFRGPAAHLFRQLLDASWLADLFAAGLVEFRKADIALEGYELVVEARRIRPVSYPPEWPTAMLREAGSTIAQVGLALAEHDLGLQDAHPWNVLFDGPRAVFVDLGSLIETSDVSRAWVKEFRRHVVSPLALHRIGLHGLGDAVMTTQRGGWTGVLDRRFLRWFPIGYLGLARESRDPRRFYAGLTRYMSGMPDRGTGSRWSTYYVPGDAEVGDPANYTAKQSSVSSILATLPSGTLIDVGANAGWYSRLATAQGHTVTALDMDDRALGELFHEARRESQPILPLKMNIMWPTGSSGFGLEYKAAPDRLRSDVVLALAVIHHLVANQMVTFEAFARVMDMFTARFLVLEWIPADDALIDGWSITTQPDYNLDALLSALGPFFDLRESLPSSPSPRRILLLERRQVSVAEQDQP